MNIRRFPQWQVSLALLCGFWGIALQNAHAQTYHNLSNARFRTTSSGVQSAMIVDVDDPKDINAVRAKIVEQAHSRAVAQSTSLQREIAFMRRHRLVKPNQTFGINETVIVRSKGQLQLPTSKAVTRGAGDELTFNIVTSGEGAFAPADASELQSLINLIYPELRDNILGRPGWSGNVIVKNLDPRLGKVDELLGALLVINGNNVEMWFPTFSAYETRFLAMAQVMAQAFHAKQPIAYHAWEIGMARAVAVATAVRLQSRLTGQNSVDPSNGFYFTPYYDVLNQPALANNTFTPPTKSNQPFNAATLSGMLVPRMQMSSTAWLKCYIENPNFFKQFNTGSADGLGTGGYYGAFKTDSTVANDVTRLRAIAKTAVSTVELLDFDAWFEQQFVLDTSITPGNKIYVYSQPTFPTNTQGTDSGSALFMAYYRTTGTGDETDLSGAANLIYWDYNFVNRLLLPSFEAVDITNGFGTVAPFFTDIGGNPADKMRIAIDVPLNQQYARIYFPAGQTGSSTSPNDVSGVLIGATDGAISVTFDGGTGPITGTVVQGAFGLQGGNGSMPEGFSRTRIAFTPTGGNAVQLQRNTYQRRDSLSRLGVFPIFNLFAVSQTQTLTHVFPAGPQLITIPLKPFSNDIAKLLGVDPNKTLLAQYRQDLSGNDKYLKYPSLPLYQPGYALWSNFSSDVNATNITGERTDAQPFVSVSLPFGWTQIGSPYASNLNITTDIQFQYLGGEVLTLAEAITRNIVAVGVIGWTTAGGYQDITTSATQGVPKNTLEAWKGYWIRVLATEGVTLTYLNPVSRSVHSRAVLPPPAESNHWRVSLVVRDALGNESGAGIGQSPNGSDIFVPSLHVAEPPPFMRSSTLSIRFPHADWEGGGNFLADIRRSNSRSTWDFVVTTPQAEQEYRLVWQGLGTLPRGTRLTLIDIENGSRQLLNSRASYTFRTGANTLTRKFQIVAEPRGIGHLRVMGLTANTPFSTSGRATQSVTINYDLTAAASTQIEIRLGGRTVRRLGYGRAVTSGANQVVWDTKDDAGRTLPGGTYMIEVTARNSDGEQTRAIIPLLLAR
ncbi:MAG: hypothetical protein NT023_03530 [Armatimonadetes bacterium]|nr:hypothetical protein [Armatimonadota bacterium]